MSCVPLHLDGNCCVQCSDGLPAVQRSARWIPQYKITSNETGLSPKRNANTKLTWTTNSVFLLRILTEVKANSQ
jgi:hypothetical protein